MRHAILALAVMLASAAGAAAQQASSDTVLSETQQLGRRLYTQSCLECHTRPHITAGLYGPVLSRDSAGGQTDVMRAFISEGTPRMPAFKYNFQPTEIDGIVEYLKIIPKPSAKPGAGGGKSGPVD